MPVVTLRDWIPVALSADLPAATVIPAHTPSGILALWRSANGELATLADRCPHRGMRLSYGFVRGEALSCIYHGWSYGQNGQCRRIPAHPDLTPPAAIKAASYPTEERNGVIWIALGEPKAPPPALEGFKPLRSITLEVDAKLISATGDVRTRLAGVDVLLLIVGISGSETVAHLMVDAAATESDCVTVSRAAEGWRRECEQLGVKELAS
ncbi:oxidoreductase [Pleomorphomonas diazotrophica]|uniref:Oxidoreductase n=1 Tax=Pleomorphomonas diazotrophica TaxID=1166257 RepID=A0A1I4VEX7_9HYPH|nr:Rieske (2Fe-2S) protein [Pleomorphomonas diazotrophica]PKR90054.1 oxidoreductase [Pleomorphomonas diazotrophica]SFM99725.1 Rieske [2Fe-2S] domain-containing protein [Pleomorphomonas diazotrophica]